MFLNKFWKNRDKVCHPDSYAEWPIDMDIQIIDEAMSAHMLRKVSFYYHYSWGLDRTKKEPSIFLKILSKHRQVISSKFPKSFRSARDFSGVW